MPEPSSAAGGDEWLTVDDVASELGVHPATVRAWASDGSLGASRAGKRKWRFRRSALDEFLRAHGGEQAEETAAPRARELDPAAVNLESSIE